MLLKLDPDTCFEAMSLESMYALRDKLAIAIMKREISLPEPLLSEVTSDSHLAGIIAYRDRVKCGLMDARNMVDAVRNKRNFTQNTGMAVGNPSMTDFYDGRK